LLSCLIFLSWVCLESVVEGNDTHSIVDVVRRRAWVVCLNN